ncbi:MAG: leucine-rich repeat protein [Ruminococcus sp.]|nr:leucine-rich repeat protein [Ruminococcus sp.]
MKNRVLSTLIAGSIAVGALSVMPVSAQTLVYEDFEYQYINDLQEIEITGYLGTDRYVDIPETINGVTVTSIGESAFRENEYAGQVILPRTVTIIKKSAFYGSKLSSIVMKGVETLEAHAFSGCTSLDWIYVDDKLKNIHNCAFQGTRIRDIVIPSSVEFVEQRAFNNTTGTHTVYIEDGLTEIGEEAFLSAQLLDWVYIPPSVEKIGDYAFGYFSFDHIRYNENLIIYGHEYTAGWAYAVANNITFREMVMGDVDFNGAIDSLDASMMLSYYASEATNGDYDLTRVQTDCSDVNADGEINALDASEVLTYYAYTATGGTGSFTDYLGL